MRQLREQGWLHHLARHAVSCFLTEGIYMSTGRSGRDVFDRDLLDADWAINNFNWLGLAGVAPWSPPFFRVYNPFNVGSSLNVRDAEGKYVDRFVPELSKLPPRHKYAPWLAPKSDPVTKAGGHAGERRTPGPSWTTRPKARPISSASSRRSARRRRRRRPRSARARRSRQRPRKDK